MTTRHASCSCGRFRLSCEGDPIRVSVCHCLACQRRTGSVFGAQARFGRDQITAIEGRSTQFARTGDSGTTATFHFCPTCGSTLYWESDAMPDVVYVPVGAFGDPKFLAPTVSVYEERRHAWVTVPDGPDVEQWD